MSTRPRRPGSNPDLPSAMDAPRMDSFGRLLPYVWPYRGRLAVSWVLAVFVALFWGLNLSAAYPVVKTLLEGKSLHEEVDRWADGYEEDMRGREAKIAELDREIAVRRSEVGDSTADEKLTKLTLERTRQTGKLDDATTSLGRMEWVRLRVLPWVPKDSFETFALMLGLLFTATMLKCGCVFVQEVLVGQVVETTLRDVRKDCLSHALELDYPTVAKEGTAGLMARFTYDAQQLAEGLQLLSGRLVREPLKAIACVVLAVMINWRLTLLSVTVVRLLGFALYSCGKAMKRASKRMMESMTRIYEHLEETLDGIKAVLAFGRQDLHREEFDREYDVYLKKAVKVLRVEALTKPTTELLSTVAVLLAMLPCSYLVLSGKTEIAGVKLAGDTMDIASVVALYAALAGLLDPCQKLSKVYARLKRCGAAGDRIFEFLDTESGTTLPAEPAPMPAVADRIDFREVTFQYPQGKGEEALRPMVLDRLNLTIDAGECVAVVGENGCGKSTLLSLLPRFYEPTAGEIFVDGVRLSEVDPEDVRSSLSLVAQDTTLFSGTIRDNIRYGRPDATDEEVEAAAEAASVTQFVAGLPQGMATDVGTKGQNLSGGQRQRIAMARAILRDPALLLLDEATSAIDAQSEHAIHATLKSFTRGRTTLLITHTMSPSLLDFVTRVVVLSEGRVEADGTHAELLATSPTYQRLFTAPTRLAA